MKNTFDPEKLQLPPEMTSIATPSKQLPRHRPSEKFLKGPIPWPWLQAAARLPGSALAVGILLWQRAGYHGKRNVCFCQKWGAEMGISIPAVRRGLKALEQARLVSTERAPGKAVKVTINGAVDHQH